MTGPFFQARTVGIGKLLSEGSRFVVPHHQRDYSWTQDEIGQLFADIEDARTTEQDTYFFGLMVFIPNGREEFVILDGQQRLATAVIMLSAIRTWLRGYQLDEDAQQIQSSYIATRELGGKALRPRIVLNETNDQVFQDYVVNEIPSKDIEAALTKLKRYDPNRRLLEAVLFCRQEIDRAASREEEASRAAGRLYDVVGYLHDKVQSVCVSVPSESDAYTVFETLNARGLDLTVLDLLKNYLFGRGGSETGLRDIRHRWTQMMATLTNVRGDDFLKAYWTSRHGRTQTAKLFPNMKQEIRSFKDALDISADMLGASEQFAALEVADDPTWGGYSEKARDHIRALKLLGSQQVHPVLLSALAKLHVPEVERLLRLLEVLIVRYQLIGGERTGRLEIACAKLAADIFQGKIRTATEAFQSLREIYPADRDFEASFTNKQERNNTKAHYLLRTLEWQARQTQMPGPGALALEPSKKKLTVEHVLPRNPGIEWDAVLEKDATLAEDCTYRLGNLCLLTKINKDLGSKSYDDKRKALAKSPLLLTQEAAGYQEWNREAIETRQAELAKLAVLAWRFQ